MNPRLGPSEVWGARPRRSSGAYASTAIGFLALAVVLGWGASLYRGTDLGLIFGALVASSAMAVLFAIAVVMLWAFRPGAPSDEAPRGESP